MNYLEVFDYDDEDDMIYRMLLNDDNDHIILRFIRLRQQQNVANRRPQKRQRYYLTRPELQQTPMESSGWQSIYRSREDRAYIHVLGIDVETFDYFMDSGFRHAWNTRTIKRTDTNRVGASRVGARSLDAAGGLGLALHFLCSTMSEVSLQIIFALVPSTVLRYIDFALEILLEVLKRIPQGRLYWPKEEVMQENSDIINAKHRRAKYLKGAFGFMDGLNLPVSASGNVNEQNANFNGWLHAHVVSNVIVFSPNGTIMSAVINAPGSWHDSNVACQIYTLLREKTPNGFFLLADSAFPRLGAGDAQKIKVPLKKNAVLPGDNQEMRRKKQESREVITARQAVEWGMRSIQGCFSRLYMPLDAHNAEGRARLLQICMRLHNVRTERVKTNQIKTVYMPIDRIQQFYAKHGVDFD
ncbi:unnamed protein product [Rhizoctonia solani]|uniref:DDE Tnp4 domain-containing protein n=1 Tax=Rhizoctonia solani TaxID=456999 RepID=A0A8H2X4S6_9AGAM|nr:unnamed protein product [Rhizoctonia solani]